MSNDSRAPATTIRPTGRPKSADASPPAATDLEHAIGLLKTAIVVNLPPGANLQFFIRALADFRDLCERRACEKRPFFTVLQLMERYGLARKTVERLPIPRHKIGGVVRYAASDVDAYEAKCREETAQNA